MTRYWPLTAVLLAFWLGNETGAQGGAAETKGEFDNLRVRELRVTGSLIVEDGAGNLVRLKPDGIRVARPRPGGVDVIEFDSRSLRMATIPNDAAARPQQVLGLLRQTEGDNTQFGSFVLFSGNGKPGVFIAGGRKTHPPMLSVRTLDGKPRLDVAQKLLVYGDDGKVALAAPK